jgi:hypothetical protein
MILATTFFLVGLIVGWVWLPQPAWFDKYAAWLKSWFVKAE